MSTDSGQSKKIIVAVAVIAIVVAIAYAVKRMKTANVASSNTRELYDKNCAACHRADGGGAAGPNLVDDFWIYGKNWADVADFIAKGNEAGGMPAYKDTLRSDEIQQLTDYVRSLQGSNPANPKAPQGFGYKMPTDAK